MASVMPLKPLHVHGCQAVLLIKVYDLQERGAQQKPFKQLSDPLHNEISAPRQDEY